MQKENKLACIVVESPFLSWLSSSNAPNLVWMLHLPQPSIALHWYVLSNTQTNKLSYPSSQAFLKVVIVVVILEKKQRWNIFHGEHIESWWLLKTKIKTLKTCYVHTIILSNSLPFIPQSFK
jgi:hypothetical protein